MPRNNQLHHALMDVVRSFIGLLKGSWPANIKREQKGCTESFDVMGLLWDNKEALEATSAWKLSAAALHDDPTIGPQLGKLVGIDVERRRCDTEDLLLGIICRSLAKEGDCEFNQELFDREYAELEAYLYSDTIPMLSVAPLLGVRAPEGETQLDPAIRIVSLSRQDATHRVGRLSSLSPPASFWELTTRSFTVFLEIETEEEKHVGESMKRTRFGYHQRIRRQVDNVVTAMRLLGAGAVGPLFVSSSPTVGYTGLGRTILGWAPRMLTVMRSDHDLSPDDLGCLVGWMPRISGCSQQKGSVMRTSLHWFNRAGVEEDIEDRLVGLMVAAEAFFLKDAEGELSHRLAERAACYVGDETASKREVYELVKAAYHCRSKILHSGETPKMRHLGPSAKNVPFAEIVNRFEGVLRASLRKALCEQAERRPCDHPELWLELVLGAEASHASER